MIVGFYGRCRNLKLFSKQEIVMRIIHTVVAVPLDRRSQSSNGQSGQSEVITISHPRLRSHLGSIDFPGLSLLHVPPELNKKAVRLMAQLIKFYYLLYLNKRWLNSQ